MSGFFPPASVTTGHNVGKHLPHKRSGPAACKLLSVPLGLVEVDGVMNPRSVRNSSWQAIVLLASAMSISQLAHGTVATSAQSGAGAAVLAGMWCTQDAQYGETIVDYSASGLEVTAFTVLSEADPRHIGRQSSMQLTVEAPNVFVRRDATGADQVFSVYGDGLTVASVWVENRGTRQEVRQSVASQSYYRCDVRSALQRAQAFLSSPKAEAATRKALQREAEMKAQAEQWAEVEQRRAESRDAFYSGVIRQLTQGRTSID
jgi:hypothetical protein